MAETTYTGDRQPVSSERSIADLVGRVVGNAEEIIRSEIRLARTEFKEEAAKAAKAGAMLAGGAVIGLFGLGFFLWSIIFGLSSWIPMSASALIIGIVLLIAASVALLAGRERMKAVSVRPERTMESLREDAQWLRNQTR